MTPLAGRIAVVTGAAGALGQAVLTHFKTLGATSIALDRQKTPLGDAAAVYACDLTDEDSVRQTFDTLVAQHPRIDVLANIAGGFAMGPQVHEATLQDWEAMLKINAMTALWSCKYALPVMRKAGFGRIINIGARAARRPAPGMAPYCVSKAAVISLTEVLALECADRGITVNCILPGTIDTERNRLDMPDADYSRWVPTSDLAVVIGQLADPAAQSVNGAVVPVYGRS